MNILDFENADIGKLAIHIRESLHHVVTIPIAVNSVIGADLSLYQEEGDFLGFALQNNSGVTGVLQISDGPTSENRFLFVASQIAGLRSTFVVPGQGWPFRTGLVLGDPTAAGSWLGQVFVRPRRWR